MTDAAVAVTFFAVMICIGVISELITDILGQRWRALVLSVAVGLALLLSFALATAPARMAVVQDGPEPTATAPWPTETPYTCADLKPWVDVLVDLQAQCLHYLEDMSMTPTSTPWIGIPTVTPTVQVTLSPTLAPTATPASIMCKRCQYESECGPGYRCHLCSDGLGRCVRREMPNGDCQTCVNAGLP